MGVNQQLLWLSEGTQWSNNSCAYDAVVTVLFNGGRRIHLQTYYLVWRLTMDMTGLIHGFNNHTNRQLSGQRQPLFEDIRNCMQRELIHLSATFNGVLTAFHLFFNMFCNTI